MLGRGAGGCNVVTALGSSWRQLFGQVILRHLLSAIRERKRAALTSYTWVDEPATAFIKVAPIIAEMWQEKLPCEHAIGDQRQAKQ